MSAPPPGCGKVLVDGAAWSIGLFVLLLLLGRPVIMGLIEISCWLGANGCD